MGIQGRETKRAVMRSLSCPLQGAYADHQPGCSSKRNSQLVIAAGLSNSPAVRFVLPEMMHATKQAPSHIHNWELT